MPSLTYWQGLGKTIEAIAGMVLRNALAQTRGDAKRPSVIVGPNSSVLKQWRDAFVLNGFPVQLLRPFGVSQDNTAFGSGIILFATRYALQAELKSIFDAVSQVEFTQPKPNPEKDLGFCVRSTSVLWPSLSRNGLFGLWLQYLSDKGALRKFNMKNSIKGEDENPSDCVSRLAAACLNDLEQSKKAVFETVVFDEVRRWIASIEELLFLLSLTHLLRSSSIGPFFEKSLRLLGHCSYSLRGPFFALYTHDRDPVL